MKWTFFDRFRNKTGVLEVLNLSTHPPHPTLSYCHIFEKDPPKICHQLSFLTKGRPPTGDDVIYLQPLRQQLVNFSGDE